MTKAGKLCFVFTLVSYLYCLRNCCKELCFGTLSVENNKSNKGGPCDLGEGIPKALTLGYILGHWGKFGGDLFHKKN